MFSQLFQSLRDEKKLYLNARKGNEFEDRIMSYLQLTLGFSRILKRDISNQDWKLIKHKIAKKLDKNFLDIINKNLKLTFIYQPYGSQQFPDFIVFTDKKIVSLEVKFSSKKQSKPVWNSNVPRANAFYIFGSYGMQDLTFFCGDDIITSKQRKRLYNFFDGIRTTQSKARADMPALDATKRGFTPYIRAAFEQRKHKSDVETNFFAHPDRKKVENLAIKKANLN